MSDGTPTWPYGLAFTGVLSAALLPLIALSLFVAPQTDDFCYNIAENPVHVHDLHATLLHCLGIDHTRLTFKFLGRDFRLTDVHGEVVKPILA
jgi:hypothetical protein